MRKKLGIGQPLINKKFKSEEEAIKYAKRLKEHIRSTCIKKKWFAQAVISISNTNADLIIDMSYVPSNKVGRPKKERHITEMKSYKSNVIEKEWHIHLLLVSYPSSAFMGNIKKYIEKNWNEVPEIFNMSDFDWKKVKVYKKYCNISLTDYIFKQGNYVCFCNDNGTDMEIVPKDFTLKKLYSEYLKGNKAKWYNDDYYNRTGKNKIMSKYNELLDYYRSITKERDLEVQEEYMKEVKSNKVQENYSRRRMTDPMFSGEY